MSEERDVVERLRWLEESVRLVAFRGVDYPEKRTSLTKDELLQRNAVIPDAIAEIERLRLVAKRPAEEPRP